MNQYLTHKVQQWTILRAIPEALPIRDREGWLLTLCFRAKLASVLSCLMVLVPVVGVVILQITSPEPLTAKRIIVLASAPILATLLVFCAIFMFRYRVELDATGLALSRFMTRTKQINWGDVGGIEFHPDDELLKIYSYDGEKISIYLSLNGLSAVRRCLAALAPECMQKSCSIRADEALLRYVPAWRCGMMDLQGSPFEPLSNSSDWQTIGNMHTL